MLLMILVASSDVLAMKPLKLSTIAVHSMSAAKTVSRTLSANSPSFML